MAENAEISIPYNRRTLAWLAAIYSVFCVIALAGSFLFAGGTVYLALTRSWFSLLGLLETIVVGACVPYFLGATSTLWRGLRCGEPAIVINKAGIVDHASTYMVGQLAWDEIQRMHPWTMERRVLPNRFFKMPIARHPGFVIVLKDKAYLERLPRTKAFQIKIDNFTGHGRWIFVPGTYLDITPGELMTQLNRFYIAEVRGAV